MKCKLAVFLMLILTFKTFAFANGKAAGFKVGVENSFSEEDLSDYDFRFTAGIDFKKETFPFLFALDFSFDKKGIQSFGLKTDYWIANPVFKNSALHYFYGPGFVLGAEKEKFLAMVCFSLGLNYFISYNTEWVFTAAAEGGGLFGLSSLEGIVKVPFSSGVRFYF
ncbi:MAG: hypothetical protein SO116_06460 [Treponema sp.]|nr:hypothetical protein [Spirochaetia bacterium]MDD7014210.1 hypothetical protein [Spirochaetales bacterium]MDY4902498.1 hypothetical protein [Treponema sp.]